MCFSIYLPSQEVIAGHVPLTSLLHFAITMNMNYLYNQKQTRKLLLFKKGKG